MTGEDAAIEWDEARSANLANWDERVPLHEQAYELAAYDDPAHLSDVVRHDLAALRPFAPSLEALDVCHLQCHIGTDTLSLARAGATVTGVDFSADALASADRLARRHGVEATWVRTDVLDARAAVSGDFDLVYTSIGTITWLSDLDRWAAQIVGLLRADGLFYIRDGHPALYSLDEDAPDLRIRYRYFANGQAQAWDEDSTYAGDGKLTRTRTYEYPHPISEVVNALIGAGLQILRLDEDTTVPWLFSPRMVEVEGGYAWPEEERDRVPCTFTIIARKPA